MLRSKSVTMKRIRVVLGEVHSAILREHANVVIRDVGPDDLPQVARELFATPRARVRR